MVNNSNNITKTKESLNSDGQQFQQYHQNEQPAVTLTHWTPKKTMTYDIGNSSLAWDRHNNVAGLDWIMGSQPSLS